MDTPVLSAGSGVRTRLARLAAESALAVDGVESLDAGPTGLRVTVAGGDGTISGVRVTAEAGGGYAVELGLRVRLQPLQPLGARVRRAVEASAQRAGMAEELKSVDVVVCDLVDPSGQAVPAGAAP